MKVFANIGKDYCENHLRKITFFHKQKKIIGVYYNKVKRFRFEIGVI